MKLKLTVAALAAAFAVPMANADVTIAGTFAPLLTYSKTETAAFGATPASSLSSTGFSNASSRFSITSAEDLGDGMKAGAFVDIRGAGGGFDDYNRGAGSGGLGVFRYGVSVGGGFGTVELGRNFSPYTWTMIMNDPHGGAIFFGPFAAMGSVGFGLNLSGGTAAAAGAGTVAFFRTGSGLHYTSNDMGGIKVRASWMTESSKNAAAGSDATEWGASVDYTPENMPLYLGAAVQRRSNYNGVGAAVGAGQLTYTGSTDTLMLIGGGIKMGDLKAGVWLENVKWKSEGTYAAGNPSEIKRNALWIPVNYTLPTGTIGAAYISSGTLGTNAADIADSKVTVMQLSYIHNLSKQTQPLIMLQSSKTGAGITGGGEVKGTMVIVGLQHSF